MGDDHSQDPLLKSHPEELVAYLDGELPPEDSRTLELKLIQSPSSRREFDAMNATWQLLSFLPFPKNQPELASQTLELIRQDQVTVIRPLPLSWLRFLGREAIVIAIMTLAMLVGVGLGVAAARLYWPHPYKRLDRDYTIATHFNDYVAVGRLDFWEALEQSDLARRLNSE